MTLDQSVTSIQGMTNSINTINELFEATYTAINDATMCRLIDYGVDPGEAWTITHIDLPLEDNALKGDFGAVNIETDHDDVFLIRQ